MSAMWQEAERQEGEPHTCTSVLCREQSVTMNSISFNSISLNFGGMMCINRSMLYPARRPM